MNLKNIIKKYIDELPDTIINTNYLIKEDEVYPRIKDVRVRKTMYIEITYDEYVKLGEVQKWWK